ncbi:MAG: hypothetical protein HY461_01930 [Parcubacteria group bacterium]|nr:hypothetical protein [Parcubacteria group bacterium]
MLLAGVVAAALLLPLAVFAVDTNPSDQQKEEAVKNVDTKLEEFLKVKDDATIPEAEKEERTAALRKEILEGVLILSVKEADDVQAQLESLSNLSDEEKKWLDAFLKDLEGYRTQYDETAKTVADGVSRDDIHAFKAWRDTVYTPRVNTIVNFALVIQERTILRVAHERQKKIATDITKLERSGHLTAEQFRDLSAALEDAGTELDEAQKIAERARALLARELEILTAETASSTAAIATSTAAAVIPLEGATSTSATTTPQETTSGAVQTSLAKIKGAYKIFLEMSQEVKRILGL